uniref:Methylase involved in ubiquinone/menaquinone biosynthesis n=1 Tax=Desulfovibrio sp. U5L TaxID=596152 RepID=I2Q5J6_9BACT
MTAAPTPHPLERYYRLHARIYDATRWSFLFGRDRLLSQAASALQAAPARTSLRIAEIGCGTGRNLAALARLLPEAALTGIDLCQPMLRRATAKASPRTRLVCAAYGPDSLPPAAADCIVFSYALTMFNPGWAAALEAAARHLAPGGLLAVADFHTTRAGWFRSWMGVNHVRLDGHLLPALAARFDTVRQEVRPAYGGLWQYFCYLGRVR